MVKVNILLLVSVVVILLFIIFTQQSEPVRPVEERSCNGQLINRSGSDWNQSGHLVPEIGLRQTSSGPVFGVAYSQVGGMKARTQADGMKAQTQAGGMKEEVTEIEQEIVEDDPFVPPSQRRPIIETRFGSDYCNKYEVRSSDYYPWWRNQHFWPYYTESYNWMTRYPYRSYWQRPYYYNYWEAPYYPSQTVLVKPFLQNMERKTNLRRHISDSFRTSKINDSAKLT